MKLIMKWSNLTAEQRKQVAAYHVDDVKDRKMVLNQHSYNVNARTGNVIFHKDF